MKVESGNFNMYYNSAESLTEMMKNINLEHHSEAERQPIMQDMVRGCLNLLAYQRYLVDYTHIFFNLENFLVSHLEDKKIDFIMPFFRASYLAEDLQAIEKKTQFYLDPSNNAKIYLNHLEEVACKRPIGLLGHSYAHHLAIMYGGQIQKKGIVKQWPDACTFCDFSSGNIIREAKNFKEKMNNLVLSYEEQNCIIIESEQAFLHTIRILNQIQ